MQYKNESHLEYYKRWGKLEKPYFKWQIRQFSNYIGQRIGDIGCGIGNFSEFFCDKELYLGFEPDKELATEFKKLHKGKNMVLAHNADVTSAEAAKK